MRVFAGPNGSGKTTIILDLKTKYSFGVYVNADDIEATLREYRKLDLRCYHVKADTSGVQDFFRKSTFAPVKLALPDLWTFFYVEDNYLGQ